MMPLVESAPRGFVEIRLGKVLITITATSAAGVLCWLLSALHRRLPDC